MMMDLLGNPGVLTGLGLGSLAVAVLLGRVSWRLSALYDGMAWRGSMASFGGWLFGLWGSVFAAAVFVAAALRLLVGLVGG